MKKTSAAYDASAIEILSGLDPVRRRPGMYVDTANPNHLAHEVIDNSIDEVLAGHGNKIIVTMHDDHSLSVADNGRGMPIDLHAESKVSAAEVILTTLHAGGKFSNQHYRYAGGLHGVGVSVVNALSTRLDLQIERGGKTYTMQFFNGQPRAALKPLDAKSHRRHGTTIRFWPDPAFFDSTEFNNKHLMHLLCAKAVLCPGLSISLHDQLHQRSHDWCYKDGFSQYFQTLCNDKQLLMDESFADSHSGEKCELSWMLNWSVDESAVSGESYVNLVPTPQGGSHVSGLRAGLAAAVREFTRFHDVAAKSSIRLLPEDVCSGLCFLLSLKLENPQFAGQTKERLSNRNASSFVQSVIEDSFSLWLNRHPDYGKTIALRAYESAQRRHNKDKQLKRRKSLLTGGSNLPGKLSDCTSRHLEDTELFLVEGDSAGGSTRQARDRRFQAVMPLRGKILNTWEIDTPTALRSEQIRNIAMAIGVQAGQSSLSGLRYGKVCILTDADSDGLHIATLLVVLFQRHFPVLIKDGRVYAVVPPLFRLEIGHKTVYARDEAERDAIVATLKPAERERVRMMRFKGLGEMNPAQLRESTMAVDKRRILRLSADGGDAHAQLDMLFARHRAAERKLWLEEKGNLAQDLL